jgi:hypothetical protein
MGDLICANGAAARVADALLRALGGRRAILRMPAPAVPADVAEQLGIATPGFQDLPLAPVLCRKVRATIAAGVAAKSELLVSATVVEAILGSLDYGSASVLFAAAYGVVVGDELLEIVATSEEQVFGKPYVYRLLLRAPLTLVV